MFLPTEAFPQRYLIFTYLCLINNLTNWTPIYPVDLVINTTEGTKSIEDSASIRQSALRNKIFCTTTMFGAFAIIDAFKSNEENWTYSTLQEINK